MSRTLITAFRQQYPQGGVVSELLCIHDGLYVVRVAAQVNDQTLATGLAAHHRIEAAEDEALARALRHLGSATLSHDLLPSLAVPPADLPQPASPLVSPETSPVPPPISPIPQTENGHQGDFLAPPAPDVDVPGIHGAEGSASPNGVLPPPASPAPVDHALEEAPAPSFDAALLNLEGLPTPSIDLSDIIAQTDVELQRLGWNVNQGREFLEKTYGKRSRHDLTDEELLEFLLFLETQPSPGASS